MQLLCDDCQGARIGMPDTDHLHLVMRGWVQTFDLLTVGGVLACRKCGFNAVCGVSSVRTTCSTN